MKCQSCGCDISTHGDRAVWPACEGGTLPTSWLDIKEICECKGFKGE